MRRNYVVGAANHSLANLKTARTVSSSEKTEAFLLQTPKNLNFLSEKNFDALVDQSTRRQGGLRPPPGDYW